MKILEYKAIMRISNMPFIKRAKQTKVLLSTANIIHIIK